MGPTSEDLFIKSSALMPGGVSSPVRAFGAVGGTPLFITSGKGCRVVDADFKQYVDMLGSWGPLILGHAHPFVTREIRQSAIGGTTFGAPTAREIAMAEMIVEAVPSVEMVRFVSSGTEAAMSALRLARAATGRTKIVKFAGCYHGHADALLVSAGSGPATLGLPDSPGVTPETAADTIVCTYNSQSSVMDAFKSYGGQIAAVIVEPVAANMGVVAPSEDFLPSLRRACDSEGALLIFDEVVTGFRVGYSGAQGIYRITPDLTLLGKIIGGGLPVGAYGGRRELMKMVAPSGPVYQAGTLSGNPIAMAAGLATLQVLSSGHGNVPDPYRYLEDLAGRLAGGLAEKAKAAGAHVTIQRVGSMLTVFFGDEEIAEFEGAKRCDTKAFARFFHAMLQEGVYWPPSQFEAAFVSTAHTEQDISMVVSAAGRAFERV